MVSRTSSVRKLLALIEAGNMKDAAAGLTDDFTSIGLTPKPLAKKQFIEFMQTFMAAFPLWRFNAAYFKEEGDTVRMKLYMMGTNTGEMNIAAMGLKGVPPTHRSVVLPAEPAEAVVKDDGQVARLTVTTLHGSSVAGMFPQLGIEGKQES